MTGGPARWRLLVDGPADGAWNMAVDEAILEGYVASTAPRAPTLRLYGWQPAALSLGRFQSGDAHDPSYLKQEGIDLVRRPTGGAAVLHDRERTYSVIGRLRQEPFPGTVLETYGRIADWLCAALQSIGVDAQAESARARTRRGEASCFASASAHEITVCGRKLVGSAQLRRAGAFLQHGSIPIHADVERECRAMGAREEGMPFADLSHWVRDPSEERLDRALVTECARRFDAAIEPGALSAREVERATCLWAWKYHSTRWTLEGRLPDRRP